MSCWSPPSWRCRSRPLRPGRSAIVAFGDSNTYGYGAPRNGTWPAQIENLLRARGYDVTIVNAGVSGDTTIDALRRFDKAFPAGTDAAIVFFGRNDWRKGTPASAIRHNLAIIVDRLRQRGIQVLLIGFKPNDFSAVAKEYGALYYPDFFDGVTVLNFKLRRYLVRQRHRRPPQPGWLCGGRQSPSAERRGADRPRRQIAAAGDGRHLPFGKVCERRATRSSAQVPRGQTTIRPSSMRRIGTMANTFLAFATLALLAWIMAGMLFGYQVASFL